MSRKNMKTRGTDPVVIKEGFRDDSLFPTLQAFMDSIRQ